jgi:hypothetical protein
MPAAIDVSSNPIIADTSKIMKRYNYKFKYTTLTGFKNVVNRMARFYKYNN